MVRVHGDRVDGGELSLGGQIQDTDNGAAVLGNQLGTEDRRFLGGHDVIEVGVPRNDSTRQRSQARSSAGS